MIPFRVSFQPGISIYEQVVYAAKKAMISGLMPPGTPFPSVRALSKEFKINPNTAHKVVTGLTVQGLLQVIPGIGTVVADRPSATVEEKKRLLGGEVERLVVEAKRIGLSRGDVLAAVASHWDALRELARQESTV